MTTASGGPATRVAIVADDLIWSTRLAALVKGSGAEPVPVRSAAALEAALADGVGRAIVDLTARAYDPLAVIALAAAAGSPVLAIGPHDDHAARKAALAAGATRASSPTGSSPTTGRPRWPPGSGEPPPRRPSARVRSVTEVVARPTIPAARYGDRLRRAARSVEQRELAALLVGVGPDLRHLTGYEAMPLERLTMLVLPARGRPTLIAPRLEGTPARSCPAAVGRLRRSPDVGGDRVSRTGSSPGWSATRRSRDRPPSCWRSPSATRCGRATSSACRSCCPARSSSARRSPASCASSRTPRRSSSSGWPLTLRTGSSTRSPPDGSSDGPRRT